jgi:NADH dehydrogenase
MQMSALKADAKRGPSHYLKSKGEAEEILRGEAGKHLDWTIFQPSVIFGEGDSFVNRFARLLRLSPLVLPLARPNSRLAPVFVGDVVAAFVSSLDDPACFGQTLQLCGPQVMSLRELARIVADSMGSASRIIALSDTLARVQARILERLPGKPFSTDNFLSLSVHSICEENGFKKLGIKPRSLQAELAHTLGTGPVRTRYDTYREKAAR